MPVDRVAEMWPRAAKLLEPALKRQGEYTLEDAFGYVEGGHWMLWLALRPKEVVMAALTYTVDFPQKRSLWVLSAGGKMEALPAMWKAIEPFAAKAGCDDLIFFGRRGWSRSGAVPAGWRHIADVISVPVGG